MITPPEVVDILLLVILAITGIAVIRTRNLFVAVMLAGIYSLISAGLFVVMDAVDVAFTEAAVGAGISTVLLLGTLALVGEKEHEPQHTALLPLFVVLITGGILVYGTTQMPPFGHPENPAHQHVAPYYLEESYNDIHIPNVVTSVLGSYRGFDTMGEVAVVFTAMVGVLLLLARGPLPKRVYHDGRWITVRAGTTREELEESIRDESDREGTGAGDGPGTTAEVGPDAHERETDEGEDLTEAAEGFGDSAGDDTEGPDTTGEGSSRG